MAIGLFKFISDFFSKNVAQTIAEGQFGFININRVQSSDRYLEKDIVEKVAGYGKQLGQIIDTLELVIDHSDLKGKEDTYAELKIFRQMAKDINDFKRIGKSSAKERVISDMSHFEKYDSETYKMILGRLGLKKIKT
jgi:hypothetical protein